MKKLKELLIYLYASLNSLAAQKGVSKWKGLESVNIETLEEYEHKFCNYTSCMPVCIVFVLHLVTYSH
jgi:hypothetical protein